MKTLLALTLALCWSAGEVTAQEMETSPTCGPVSGKTEGDLQNVLEFCKAVPAGVAVGAYGLESLLWVKVTEAFANSLLDDRIQAEQLIKIWLRGWRQKTGRQSVDVYVELRDVEIARGETTLGGGDKVTIKRR